MRRQWIPGSLFPRPVINEKEPGDEARGHAGRSRDAKPGTSHQEEVTAILHAAINLCSLTLLLFDSERKGLRHV